MLRPGTAYKGKSTIQLELPKTNPNELQQTPPTNQTQPGRFTGVMRESDKRLAPPRNTKDRCDRISTLRPMLAQAC